LRTERAAVKGIPFSNQKRLTSRAAARTLDRSMDARLKPVFSLFARAFVR
jgi:hypothetical protein